PAPALPPALTLRSPRPAGPTAIPYLLTRNYVQSGGTIVPVSRAAPSNRGGGENMKGENMHPRSLSSWVWLILRPAVNCDPCLLRIQQRGFLNSNKLKRRH